MRYGIMYKQGEIVLIPVPFSDLSSTKRRPVLILSNTDYNGKTNDIVVAAITSNIQNKAYEIIITHGDLLEGKLKIDSCIRADKLYTLSQNIIIKTFGRVNSNVVNDVNDKIRELFQFK